MSKKETLTNLILSAVKLFTDGDDAYCAYYFNNKNVTEKITARSFKRYVRKIARDSQITLSETSISEIILQIEAEAIFTGHKCTTHNRIGKHKNSIIINPCFDNGDIIVVDSTGWKIQKPFTHQKVLDNTLPAMLTTKGMKSLPFPIKGKGNIYDLKYFIRAATDDNLLLIIAFIIQSYFYNGPFPIIVLVAQPGSGKTVSTSIIKNLIDPHEAPTLSGPRDPRDMFTTAGISWLMAYDNFSSVPQWLSDLFCRFSTGGSTIDRELFTNGEAYLYSAKRPAIVNGINDFFSQSDVLQRSIIFDSRAIPDQERISEDDLYKEWNEKFPGIFHDIIELLSNVLKLLPTIELSNPTRMADFCKIGEATAQSMGYDPGYFMQAYRDNQGQANDITLDSNIFAPALKSFVQEVKYWKGTPSELLDILSDRDAKSAKSSLWPKMARGLSGQLKRVTQNLKSAGILCDMGRTSKGRYIELKLDTTQDSVLKYEELELFCDA